MRRTFGIAVLVASVVVCSAAFGNPIMSDGANAVQVPGSRHVQVTFMCLDGFAGCAEPEGLERDGEQLDVTWTRDFVSHNGGSGVEGYVAYQVCDCGLSVGTYTYKIDAPAGAMTPDWTMTVTVTEPIPPQDVLAEVGVTDAGPADAASPDAEVFPWDEPEPPWPQGLDCIARCAGQPVAEGVEAVPELPPDIAQEGGPAETAASDAIAPPPDTQLQGVDSTAGAETAADAQGTGAGSDGDGGSCSAGGPAAPWAALALLSLIRRRRRQ